MPPAGWTKNPLHKTPESAAAGGLGNMSAYFKPLPPPKKASRPPKETSSACCPAAAPEPAAVGLQPPAVAVKAAAAKAQSPSDILTSAASERARRMVPQRLPRWWGRQRRLSSCPRERRRASAPKEAQGKFLSGSRALGKGQGRPSLLQGDEETFVTDVAVPCVCAFAEARPRSRSRSLVPAVACAACWTVGVHISPFLCLPYCM